jgi:hypothetical protein
VYVELNGSSYARDARFKLTNKGELFDLSEAPYREIPVAADTTDSAALAAKHRLQAVLDEHPVAPGRAEKDGAKAAKKKARSRGLN